MSDTDSDTYELALKAKGKEEESEEEQSEEEDIQDSEDFEGETDDSLLSEDEDEDEDDEAPRVVIGDSKVIDETIQFSEDEEDEPLIQRTKGKKEATMNFQNITKARYDEYLKQKPNEPTFRYRIRIGVVGAISNLDLSYSQIITCSEAITNKLLNGATYSRSFEDYLKSLKR